MFAPIVAPSQCPSCEGAVTTHFEERSKISTHWCENLYCPGRIVELLTYVADRTLLEIDGLGPELAASLVGSGYVYNLADLFDFAAEFESQTSGVSEARVRHHTARSGLPNAATIAMVASLSKARHASWDRWVASLGIPAIGHRLGKVIARELALQPEDMGSIVELLGQLRSRTVEGLGPHKLAEIERCCNDANFQSMCLRLYERGVRPAAISQPQPVKQPLTGMIFCITGEFWAIGSRDYIIEQLVNLGAVSKSGVSKKVTHLIVGSEPGRVKLDKARALGVAEMDDAGLEALCQEHGIKIAGRDNALDWVDG